jgi:cytochrome oxidase assembly protein ShyY1
MPGSLRPQSHGFRFGPPWWGVLLAAAGCAAGIALGHWQSGRADEKRAAAAAAQKPETLRGELLARHTLFLQNRPHRGKPGYYVVQPLRIAEGRHVLVLRGWSAVAAPPPTPAATVSFEGVRRERLPRAYEVGNAAAGAASESGHVRQNVSVGEFSAWSGLALEPTIIEQRSALVVTQPGASDGLVREWPAEESGASKHEAYALQWYSLAGLCVVLLVILGFKREKPSS